MVRRMASSRSLVTHGEGEDSPTRKVIERPGPERVECPPVSRGTRRRCPMGVRPSTITTSRRVRRIARIVVPATIVTISTFACLRSFSLIDHVGIRRATHAGEWNVRFSSGEGNLSFEWEHMAFVPGGYSPIDEFRPGFNVAAWEDPRIDGPCEGIHFVDWRTDHRAVPGYHSLDLRVGYPTVIALFIAALAGARVARRLYRTRRADRSARGLCRSCGYDLRASQQRCPECGAVIPTGAT